MQCHNIGRGTCRNSIEGNPQRLRPRHAAQSLPGSGRALGWLLTSWMRLLDRWVWTEDDKLWEAMQVLETVILKEEELASTYCAAKASLLGAVDIRFRLCHYFLHGAHHHGAESKQGADR